MRDAPVRLASSVTTYENRMKIATYLPYENRTSVMCLSMPQSLGFGDFHRRSAPASSLDFLHTLSQLISGISTDIAIERRNERSSCFSGSYAAIVAMAAFMAASAIALSLILPGVLPPLS